MNSVNSGIRYVLDTDSVTYQQLGRAAICQHLERVEPTTVATTVITFYEQLRGRLASINRKQSDEEMRLAYQRLQATQDYYCCIPVLPFNTEALEQYHSLQQQGIRIGTQDLKIAAIVLANAAVLVTSNLRHFDRVPGLSVEDWNC